MQKNITHIEKQRIIELTNSEFIQEEFDMSLYDYNSLVFACGMAFLDAHFPEKEPIYIKYFIYHSTDALFWKWWRNEWSIWQQDLVKKLFKNETHFTYEMWLTETIEIIDHQLVFGSFKNYLKISKTPI